MNITQASLKNPAAVAVAVALVVVFGLLAMTRLPLQLFPDIDQPQIGENAAARHAQHHLLSRQRALRYAAHALDAEQA